MSATKRYLEQVTQDGNYPDVNQMTIPGTEPWDIDELEPMRSECCNAPVNNVHGHFICSRCKMEIR